MFREHVCAVLYEEGAEVVTCNDLGAAPEASAVDLVVFDGSMRASVVEAKLAGCTLIYARDRAASAGHEGLPAHVRSIPKPLRRRALVAACLGHAARVRAPCGRLGRRDHLAGRRFVEGNQVALAREEDSHGADRRQGQTDRRDTAAECVTAVEERLGHERREGRSDG